MSRLAYLPSHPGWRRLAAAVLANEHAPGDPEAMTGLDDHDEDVDTALAHRLDRNPK